MNEIIGYDEHAGRKIPRFSGPCKRCGAENYGLSTSGPDFCGSCAIGRPVAETQLMRRYREALDRNIKLALALEVALGRPLLTPEMQAIGEQELARVKSERC